MTTTSSIGAWDEPSGLAARGTVVVLTGRGETALTYQRFGRRLAADAYRVRVVETDLDDLETTRKQVQALLTDSDLPAPRVLAGSDTGASYATRLASDLPGVDGVVLAGLAAPQGATVTGWVDELDARSACPTHRRTLTEDDDFTRGALSRPVPAGWEITEPGVPALVLHGDSDPVTPLALLEPLRGLRFRTVAGGRHDVLNDVSHRSVASTVVLFLESLKLGGDLPDIVV